MISRTSVQQDRNIDNGIAGPDRALGSQGPEAIREALSRSRDRRVDHDLRSSVVTPPPPSGILETRRRLAPSGILIVRRTSESQIPYLILQGTGTCHRIVDLS